MTTPGSQDNRAQDGGTQNIAQHGDVHATSTDNRQYVFLQAAPASPQQQPGKRPARLLRPVPLAVCGVLVAAAAVALALGGRQWFGTAGDAADATPPGAAAGAATASAGPAGRSAPPSPSGTAERTREPSASKTSEKAAPPEPKEPAAASPEATGARLEATVSSPYPDAHISCGHWRGTGFKDLEMRGCVQAVDHSGSAQFGVIVRNSRAEQALVTVDVAWYKGRVPQECDGGSALRHVVIDPGKTWYSSLASCSADAVEGSGVQSVAWASLDPGRSDDPRKSGQRTYSPTAQIQQDGSVTLPPDAT
ncbi:hypothetical protein C3486_23230 [Streptomyces sp. Ru73]|uniref:hypothetical protein n=1 Tax=Streptomyces sp. Ru73 TaxID=2080748 RepID=UPI000CDCE3FA|nr:hypothetical protein [Streptomyces sp. Ru73]POX38442.1 hypothetical protein C3486_23230 [Streptomyces sp. Ru73]